MACKYKHDLHVDVNQHKDGAYIYEPFRHMLNVEGIQSPVPLSSIGKFESQNPDISVSVMYRDGDQIVPICTLIFADPRKHHITLFVITNGNEKFHYLPYKVCLDWYRLERNARANITYVTLYCLYPF